MNIEEIALIDPDIWEQGPEVVNALIAEIVDKHNEKKARAPEDPVYNEDTARGPLSVTHLTENRIVAQMATEGLAAQISGVIEKYGADTGANQLPEAFLALRDLPPVLRKIALQVKTADGSQADSDALIAEIKRLNARIERLEGDLRSAKEKTLKEVFSKSFAEQAGKSLGDWKMWGALASTAVLLSGSAVVAGMMESIGQSVQEILPDGAAIGLPDLENVAKARDV